MHAHEAVSKDLSVGLAWSGRTDRSTLIMRCRRVSLVPSQATLKATPSDQPVGPRRSEDKGQDKTNTKLATRADAATWKPISTEGHWRNPSKR